METDRQARLIEEEWGPAAAPGGEPSAAERQVRLKRVQRDQMLLCPVEVERLLGPEHPARAIWALVGSRNLAGFLAEVDAVEGVAGRPALDPRLLISMWIYAYSEGTPSAREIARQCAYHPAYQWLTGVASISAHTLSDFRTAHGPALRDLAAQVLALLAEEGLVDLEQVTQDGTKIRASAGADTFRREEKIRERMEQARRRLAELEGDDSEQISQRTLEARMRGAREKLQRMEQALEELNQVRQARPAAEQKNARVSTTDPEARTMKQSDGGFAPSYNLQLSTDAQQTVIVSVEVTQQGSDIEQLQPALERLQQEAGQAPRQVLVDGGYTSRENIMAMAAQGVDLIGPPLDGQKQKETLYQIRGVAPEFRPEAFRYDAATDGYLCPAGKTLRYKSKHTLVGQTKYTYVATDSDCAACTHKPRCCATSKSGRSVTRGVDAPEMAAFRTKMQTAAAKAVYRKRGAVAEFPHLWIKQKFGVRQFSVRGLRKVRIEAHWMALTYNIQQWIRLCWRPKLALGVS